MKYITGIHALNLKCSLDTAGDWHQSSLKWEQIKFNESQNSFFGVYGLEVHDDVPEHPGEFIVANHIRALLDLLVEGDFGIAQGMNEDFVCNPKYNDEIFSKVIKMKELSHWEKIKLFMFNEYGTDWIDALRYVGEEFEIPESIALESFEEDCFEALTGREIERIIYRRCLTLSGWNLKINNLIDLVKLYNLYKNELSKEIINNICDVLERISINKIKWILENTQFKEYNSDKVLNDLELLCNEIGVKMEK